MTAKMTVRGQQLLAAASLCFASFTHLHAAAPTAQPDSRSVNEYTAITINVLENDFDTDGDSIQVVAVSEAANGQVTLNPDGSIFYQPNEGFSNATDTFTYTLADDSDEGLTSTATVTISVVAFDMQPFTQGRGNDLSLAETINSLCGDIRELSDAELGGGRAQIAEICQVLASLNNGEEENAEALSQLLTQIAPEETMAQMRVALGASRGQVKAVSQRVQQQRSARQGVSRNNIALNGRSWLGGAAGDDLGGLWSRLGIFASAQVEEAEREATSLEAGYESSGFNINVGADYFVSQNWLLGASFSYVESELDYLLSTGTLDSEISSLSAFAAYYNQNLSAHVQMGVGQVNFDSTRNVNFSGEGFSLNHSLSSETEGDQFFINSRLDYDWQHKALSVTPFIRADYLTTEIKAFEERGYGGLAMAIGEQSSDQLTLGAGVQTRYAFKPSWGVFVPSAGITFFSETEDERDPVSAGFAADPNSSRKFLMRDDGGDSQYGQFALGASAVLTGGLSLFAEYTYLFDYDYLSAYQVQLGARYEL